MAKFIKSITLLLLFCLTASAATAMVEVQSNKNDQRKGLRVTSFLDYPPFGEVVTAEYSVPKMHTIYDQFIEITPKTTIMIWLMCLTSLTKIW